MSLILLRIHTFIHSNENYATIREFEDVLNSSNDQHSPFSILHERSVFLQEIFTEAHFARVILKDKVFFCFTKLMMNTKVLFA